MVTYTTRRDAIAAVVHELIASAKEHITLATYSAGNVDDLVAALDRRRRDGVEIRLLLETVRSDRQGPDCPKLFEELLPLVKALQWPRKIRPSHGWTSMHVKVLIRDDDAVLVTSANMSGAAMRDNMEIGVKLRGGSTARRLRKALRDLEKLGGHFSASSPIVTTTDLLSARRPPSRTERHPPTRHARRPKARIEDLA